MTLHENMDDAYFGITDMTRSYLLKKKVLKNAAYVTVTPETSIIAFGTNDTHYEGKNKRNLLAIIQLMNKYSRYA
jgi:hypothetical protein